MDTAAPRPPAPPPTPRFAELFAPKLLTVLREGYGWRAFRADAVAGLTVAVVALPLSMAIAIAAGATPAQGLTTAIVGGFLVSALGGSRFQIGGPAGAFIVLMAGTLAQHGPEGLVLAVFLSGLILAAMGLLRLGTYIKFVPYPVTIGFTAGIAVIIFATQIKDFAGLALAAPEPGPLMEKIPALWAARSTWNGAAFALAAGTTAAIFAFKRFAPHWPGLLIAVVAATLAAQAMDAPIDTIGARFGGLPPFLPAPRAPAFDLDLIFAVLPNAISFALLGAIESLLSAVVADGMTGRRHRSNCELLAQGTANIGSALFGGLCVTGAIARTAANVRAGAHGPIAGMMHALFLLTFMLAAAPLVAFIPLAALAAVLANVAWGMIERPAIAALMRGARGDAAIFVVTLLLTIFRDLTEAIVIGFALGSVLFLHRMSKTTAISAIAPLVPEDEADAIGGRGAYPGARNTDIAIYRISGALFFGAAASIGAVLDRIGDTHHTLILDFCAVPFIDSTGANMIEGMARAAQRRSVRFFIAGAAPDIRGALEAHNVRPPHVVFAPTLDAALAVARTQDQPR